MARLSEGANQASNTLREFNRATERLREAVGGLKDEVSRFNLGPAEPASLPSLPAGTPADGGWGGNRSLPA
jgi:methyl-accepting chemotaxis protein WspA